MNVSFELLSSMSPKIDKNAKLPRRKPATKLALKKYFRRSSLLPKTNNSAKNESIITIGSSSTSSSESSSSDDPIIISDSEDSFKDCLTSIKESPVKKVTSTKNVLDKNRSARLSQEKFTKILLWVDGVNSAKQNSSLYSNVSTVHGDDNPAFIRPATNTAASSTLLDLASKRFDELFKHEEPVKEPEAEKQEDDVVNDSLISEDLSVEDKFKNMTLDDSLLTQDESLTTRIKKSNQIESNDAEKLQSPESTEEYESLLDSIYGDSWREKKDEVLPSSEPRLQRGERPITQKVANTEKPVKSSNYRNPYLNESNNLLKTLQRARFRKALESPWSNVLKNICDSDSDDSEEKLPRKKLDFDENNDKGEAKQTSADKSTNVQVKPKTAKKIIDNVKPQHKPKTTTVGNYSFLASLSGSVPISRCDMSALIYRNNFKQHKEKLALTLFNLYNENIFENSIPKNTLLEWNDRMRRTAGSCHCKKIFRSTGATERAVKIVLSSKVIDSADRLRDTLVHEMCHAVTWIVNQVSDGHGPFWRAWADRAMKAFPELPPIKRCHQYVINTKYTYRCQTCGYCIGRHTKSLDTIKKCCGHCMGRFELLINKTTKKGETMSVPVTPKKATGFALFVKENYATHKTPDLKHADIMKILGQKFANLKCEQAQET